MTILDLIAQRRDGRSHDRAGIEMLVSGATGGSIPDYQLTAWLMAAYSNPLTLDETAWLTLAMAESGERMDLSGLPHPCVDKHSTGGVGDKTTLVALPILAACGATCVKLSGRGLGSTGGTVDKLASIPGFRLDLGPEEMRAIAATCGIALSGQSPNLAPADKVLYALRDATSTVDSVPLIVASILSKKLAVGAEVIVLDVKCGSGAFMRDREAAEELAGALREVATRIGVSCDTVVTDMDQPLGVAVGNALEVAEAMASLRGEGPARLETLAVELAARCLTAAGQGDLGSMRREAADALHSGRAAATARVWLSAQGADSAVVDDPWSVLARARVVREATWDGGYEFVERVDAGAVGRAVVDLGGGRRRKEDEIDPTVGVEVLVEVGDRLEPGQPIFRVHARTDGDAEAAEVQLRESLRSDVAPAEPRPILL